MALDKKYAADMLELLKPCGQVTGRAMFGGYGIWERGVMFALLDSDSVLYFKTDSTTESMYKAEGASQFTPKVSDKEPTGMPYWSVPASVLDDQEELEKWAKQSIFLAHSAASAKRAPVTAKLSATKKPAKTTKKSSTKKVTTKKATRKSSPKKQKSAK